jgi:hypothetical protein
LTDEQASGEGIGGRTVLDCHPHIRECRHVLVDRVQRHAVWLHELLNPIVAGDRPVEIERAYATLASADGNPRNRQPVSVGGIRDAMTRPPLVWVYPRLDDQHPARTHVVSHVRDGCSDVVETEQIADAASEASHDVEATVHPERSHVGLLELNVWEFALSLLKHCDADVDAGNIGEVPTKDSKMTTGSARNVQK